MKKFLYSAAALALAFFAASCQQENLEPVVSGNTVTYTVEVPGALATRALGDETTAVDKVYYEVYRALEVTDLDAKPVYEGNEPVSGGKASFELEFVKDQEFVVLFWAQDADLTMFDITDLRKVTLTTPGASNNENAQVFAGSNEVADCVPANGGKVTLIRPISQLNIFTTKESLQFGTKSITLSESTVKVSGLYTTYNVATGEPVITEVTADFTYGLADVPATEDTDPYAYVAMNYVAFAQNASSTVDVDFTIKTSEGDIPHSVPNVPLKPNYRTNIIGNLLTEAADYNVTLGIWATEDEVVEIWDGKSIKTPDFDAATQTWTIDNGAELAWFAHAVNGDLPSTLAEPSAPAYSKEHKAVLGDHIHLGGHEWTTIGTKNGHFMGSFDGAGYTIYDFKITECCYGEPQAALFGTVSGKPTIKNLTIDGAEIVMPAGHTGDFYAAGLIGTFYGNLTIANVTVKNSKFVGNNKVAGLLAHDGVCSSLNIDNCHVLNCEIASTNVNDGGNVGGFIGLFQGVAKGSQAAPYGEHIIKNSSVKKTTINAINSSNTGKRSNGEFVACLSGKANQTLDITNCEVSENTFTQNEGVTYVSPYGVFVGGNRNDDGKGTVIVDGVEMIAPGLTKEDGIYSVSSASTLQTALERVADGETIKLDADLTITEPAYGQNALNFNRAVNCTIDLNGKTLSADTGNSVLRFNITGSGATSDVTLTLKNGKVVAGENTWCAVMSAGIEGAKAILDLQEVTIENSKAGDYGVKAWANGVVNAQGVTVTATECAGGFYAVGGEIILDNCTVDQEGLHTAPYMSMAVAVSTNGKMTVNSGVYTTEPTEASEGYNQGTSHGSWAAGIMNSGGTLIINGGTFKNGNYGDDALATNARGLIIADTGAKIEINGGTFNALKAILDVTNNLGDASRNPSVTLAGGDYSADPTVSGLHGSNLITVTEGKSLVEGTDGRWTIASPVAKVGTTTYYSIDAAIANWANNTTLTLLADVTLSDVITLKSTEHHILNLGTYTLTAASGKHAIEITCNGRANASYALTVNADAINPGGITATGKSCIYYKKSDSTKDRPIILINNGVFTGSYSINSTSNGNTNCPQIWINGGVFNSYMNLTKNMLKVSGGTFHGAINCTGDSSAYRQISGGRFKSWQFMTADASNKFWVGTAKETYDVGVYVDDEGYLVVGGPVITEFGDKFAAKATNYSKWSSYLKYSSAAANGLYYTNAAAAIAKHGEANVVLK